MNVNLEDYLEELRNLSLNELDLNPILRCGTVFKELKQSLKVNECLKRFLRFHSQESEILACPMFQCAKWRFWDFFPATNKNPSYTWGHWFSFSIIDMFNPLSM